MKKIFFTAFTAIATLAFTSCSKDAATTALDPATAVTITSTGFTPALLETNRDVVVRFINNDNQTHTVTADDGSFDSGDILQGSAYFVQFPNVDTIGYHCKIHPSEKGTVIVHPSR
jgi:plastocyanin